MCRSYYHGFFILAIVCLFTFIFIYIFAICNFQSHWARLLWTNNDEGTICSAYNVIDICDPRCDIGFISFLCYWFYIHGIVIHLLVTSVVPVILIVIVANLLFSRFLVHGIVPARLSMFPILLMSSKASLKVSTKEGIERTIVRKGKTIIVLLLT